MFLVKFDVLGVAFHVKQMFDGVSIMCVVNAPVESVKVIHAFRRDGLDAPVVGYIMVDALNQKFSVGFNLDGDVVLVINGFLDCERRESNPHGINPTRT